MYKKPIQLHYELQIIDESESPTGAIPVGDAYMRSLSLKPTGTSKQIKTKKVFLSRRNTKTLKKLKI